jgi:hypothetical protein
MATYVILGTESSDAQTVEIPMFDPTTFQVVDNMLLSNGAGRETTMQRIDGDPEYPTIVRVGYYPKTKQVNGITEYSHNVSIRETFWVKRTENSVDEYREGSIVLAWTTPWRAVPDAADMASLVGNVFSYVHPDVVSGVLTNDRLDALSQGLTNLDLGGVVRT